MSGMRRRKFITLLGGAAVAWPLAARAQQTPKVARIGVLGSTFASPWASRIEAFRSGLRDLGYVEGENIVIEFRWAEEKYDQLPHLAAELIRLKVDVLVTYGTPGSLVAKRATTTVPIVMVHSGDAVAAGIVKSLARPGGKSHRNDLLPSGTHGETDRDAQGSRTAHPPSGDPGEAGQCLFHDSAPSA
jgi:putative tryptophan/tyrosine transport system substrate-binding protein